MELSHALDVSQYASVIVCRRLVHGQKIFGFHNNKMSAGTIIRSWSPGK